MPEREWGKAERVNQINHYLKEGWFLLHQNDQFGPVIPDLIFGDHQPDK